MSLETQEENINSLCKKYINPDESITDTKASLKAKIYIQIFKLGDYICSKNFSDVDFELICEFVPKTIESCWMQWEKNKNTISYSSYFVFALKNEISRYCKKQRLDIVQVSLDEKFGEDEDMFLSEKIEDKRINIECELEKKEYLEKVEKYFVITNTWFKVRKREEWNKKLVTAELYVGLHDYFDYYPNKKFTQFSFVDEQIYNLPKEPSNKYLASLLGKDEGQVSKAKRSFRRQINDLMNKE